MLPVFGPGAFFVQRTDIANQTPVNIGKANSFKIDSAFTTKELYGQNQLPLFIARGTAKVTASVKSALISGIALAAVFYGLTLATGQQATAVSESQQVPATSTYTITPTNAATFVADVGVVYQSTGLPLKYVTSGPTVGQYTYNASTGVYTFAAADASAKVFITYTYTIAGTGQQMTITSQLLGTTPTFQAWYYTSTNNVPLNLQLYNCVGSKTSFDFKLEDFMMPDLSFSCFANAAGALGLISFGEVS